MKWKNIKLGMKLVISFGLVLVLLGVVSLTALLGMNLIVSNTGEITEYHGVRLELFQREVDHLDWVKAISEALISGNVRQLEVQTDFHECGFGKWFYGDGRKELERMLPETAETLRKLEDPHQKIHETAIEINSLLGQWNPEEKNETFTVFTQKTFLYLTEFRELLTHVTDQVEQESERLEQEVVATISESRMAVIISSLLAVLAGIVMTILITRSIVRPVRSVVTIAEQIARGDLSSEVALEDRRDEIGLLAQAFGQMLQSLREMAGIAEQIADGDLSMNITARSQQDVLATAFTQMQQALKKMVTVAEQIADGNLTVQVDVRSEKDALGKALADMAQKLHQQTLEIAEGVNVLSSSASQISAAVTQLAASAAETSTSVSETTTTLEEVRQTSELANQKSQQVSAGAQQAAQISQAGRKATDDTVDGMQRIREQMESIADSIVKLSEQSQTIGGIIATVNDLSDQSNLLAVNASIEAAKAGEQGKGFAVVAQEIRSLAEQSKQATTQVQLILSNIQKATSAAVMATEQGTKAVENGVKQSTEAGQSIMSLTHNITETAQAMTQIAASGQQQMIGMNQIADAMESIKQASIQNVDSSHQLETAANDLQEVGQVLKQSVERYTY